MGVGAGVGIVALVLFFVFAWPRIWKWLREDQPKMDYEKIDITFVKL